MPCLTPSITAVLERAYADGAVYSAADIALIEPVAMAVAPVQVANDRTIRQSIGALAASLPAQATDEFAGRLKLNTYMTMLAGCDERALAAACRRCLRELDWFPTIRQLRERIDAYVSPEQHAIAVARFIMRTGQRERPVEEPGPPLTDVELAGMARTDIGRAILDIGLKGGMITQEQYDAAKAVADSEERAAA